MSRWLARGYLIGLPIASGYNSSKIQKEYQLEKNITYEHHYRENYY